MNTRTYRLKLPHRLRLETSAYLHARQVPDTVSDITEKQTSPGVAITDVAYLLLPTVLSMGSWSLKITDIFSQNPTSCRDRFRRFSSQNTTCGGSKPNMPSRRCLSHTSVQKVPRHRAARQTSTVFRLGQAAHLQHRRDGEPADTAACCLT